MKNQNLSIQHFDSLAAFGKDCQKRNVAGSCFYSGGQLSRAWKSAQTGGSEQMVPECEKLIREFEDVISLESFMPQMVDCVAGYRPNVARYVAGYPDCMVRKVNVPNDRTPLTIWVVVTSSAGCRKNELLNRGMAITALFLALSATRSVSLRLVSGLSGGEGRAHNNIVTVQLDEPIVLGEAAWSLTAQEFARGLTYAWLSTAFRAGGGWPADISRCGDRLERVNSWRKLLPCGSEDIIFPHPFVGDPELSQPISYCKGILEGFVNERD